MGPPLAAPKLNYSQKLHYAIQSISESIKRIQPLNSGMHKSEHKYITNHQGLCLQMHNISESSIYQKANPSSTECWSFIGVCFLVIVLQKGKTITTI